MFGCFAFESFCSRDVLSWGILKESDLLSEQHAFKFVIKVCDKRFFLFCGLPLGHYSEPMNFQLVSDFCCSQGRLLYFISCCSSCKREKHKDYLFTCLPRLL
jgi:hypothetical protein